MFLKFLLLLILSNCLLVSGKSENTLSFHRLRINEQMSIINKEENAHTYALRIKRERERDIEKGIKRERETPSETHKGDGNEKVEKKRLPSILLHKREQLIEILRMYMCIV